MKNFKIVKSKCRTQQSLAQLEFCMERTTLRSILISDIKFGKAGLTYKGITTTMKHIDRFPN